MTSAGNLSDHPLSGGCELTCAPAPTNSVFVASSRQRLRDFRDQQAFDQLGPRRLSLLLDRSPKAITFEPSCGAGRWRRVGVASSAPQVYASPNGAACSPAFPRSPSSAVMSFNVITPSTSSLSASPQPTGHRRFEWRTVAAIRPRTAHRRSPNVTRARSTLDAPLAATTGGS
jgi:hypothetical protein